MLMWLYGGFWGFFNFGLLAWLPTILAAHLVYTAHSISCLTSVLDLAGIPAGFLTTYIFDKLGKRPVLVLYPVLSETAGLLTGAFGIGGALASVLFVTTGFVIYSTGFALVGMLSTICERTLRHQMLGQSGWVEQSRSAGLRGLQAYL
jgi:sugar phosphate permease